VSSVIHAGGLCHNEAGHRGKEEAPPTYEVEGASQFRSSERTDCSARQTRGTRHFGLGKPRQTSVDSMSASPEGAFPGAARQVATTCELRRPLARIRELPALSLAASGVSP
jgi:hypothetical protein